MKYDLYDESEWRIIAAIANQHHQMIDPRKTTNSHVAEYFELLAPEKKAELQYLAPLDGWFAAIIYPSIRIKNKAQENGSEVQSR